MNTIAAVSSQRAFSLTMKNCSFLCSILVIFIHSYNIVTYNISTNSSVYWFEEVVSQCIARGAVPFFFISSAFFLYQRQKDIISVYKSRFKSIVLPYLLWNVIYMLFFSVLKKLSLSNAGMDKINITNILEGIFLYKYNYAYWFMFYLILFTLLYPVIRQIICRNKLVCFLGFALLLVFYLFKIINHDIIEHLIYYYLGAILGYHYKESAEKIVMIRTRNKVLILMTLFIIGAALFVASNIYSINITLIKSVIMTLLLFFISSLQKIKIPYFLLGLSFMIYSMHPIILEIIEKIIFIVCPHNIFWAATDYVIAPIVSVFIIVALCILMKKICPTVYGLLNGNRK